MPRPQAGGGLAGKNLISKMMINQDKYDLPLNNRYGRGKHPGLREDYAAEH